MIKEWFKIPLLQFVVAFGAATVGAAGGYYWAASATMRHAMRTSPHDGQAGLGTAAAGLFAFVMVWPAVFFLVKRLFGAWERRQEGEDD